MERQGRAGSQRKRYGKKALKIAEEFERMLRRSAKLASATAKRISDSSADQPALFFLLGSVAIISW
jgi:hypothetical protein